MIEFVCVGLDIRTLNLGQPYSADATVWDQDEQMYERAQKDLKIKENSLQLLHSQDSFETSRLLDLVESVPNAVLIALELPRKVFDLYVQMKGLASMVDLTGYESELIGFDICDINGFFSFLDMDIFSKKPLVLFDEKHLMDAFVLAQAANFVIQEHSPFVVVKLCKIMRQAR